MVFSERTTQPEHFDGQRTAAELRAAYQQLARVNRLFALHDPYTRLMSRWLGQENCRELSILDVGAGDGWLGRRIERWAARRGWTWRVTDLDCNQLPLGLNHGSRRVTGSALSLPFGPASFDVVIASQMTHHFNSDEEVVAHFTETWRVARQGVFVTDMQRSPFLYAVLWLTLPFLRVTGHMRADGLLSVKKSFVVNEWAALAHRAGITNARVSDYYGARLILAARKCGATVAASETTATYREADGFYSAPSRR
jgi:ubiquinone/menaquinone biosynthesis C-methylase UbiE